MSTEPGPSSDPKQVARDFSDHDLDRSISPPELATLSEAELTKLAFWRDAKSLAFFFPLAVMFYFIARQFGPVGRGVGWLGVFMCGLFALYNVATVVLSAFSLVGTPFDATQGKAKKAFWVFLQFLLSLGNLLAYAGLAYLVYVGIKAGRT